MLLDDISLSKAYMHAIFHTWPVHWTGKTSNGYFVKKTTKSYTEFHITYATNTILFIYRTAEYFGSHES
jgi:hypothetical protein